MYPLSVQKGKKHERAGIFTATIAVRAQFDCKGLVILKFCIKRLYQFVHLKNWFFMLIYRLYMTKFEVYPTNMKYERICKSFLL